MSKHPGSRKLSSIKSGAFSRGVALARMSFSVGGKAASYAIGNVFSAEEGRAERLKELLTAQMGTLARELGQLKGSLMKVGQMLSMVGEHVLPPEANELLKTLQSQSPPLEWKAIEKVLKRQLGAETLARLEIDPEPAASASLGQVHRARVLAGADAGRLLALKIQYPGVDAAIDSDLKALRGILSMSRILPGRSKGYDALFAEVRQMLRQEVDYRQELDATEWFRERLAGDSRYVVPRTYAEFSGPRVLATSFEEGLTVDDPCISALPQERRNALGSAVLELYLKELFELGRMQTDPHFGNYRIRLGGAGEPDRLILLDFGAVREFQPRFLESYFEMVRGSYRGDAAQVARGAERLGFMLPGDSDALRRSFAELCFLLMEPFGGEYDWGGSDLPKRAARAGAELAFQFRLRPPPREVVFLDRKMGGVFIFLSALGARLDARPLLDRHLARLAAR